MKRCPKCGGKKFIVSAHVIQEWIVDEKGNFLEVTDDCAEVTHEPDDYDLWMCDKCGYEDTGREFET